MGFTSGLRKVATVPAKPSLVRSAAHAVGKAIAAPVKAIGHPLRAVGKTTKEVGKGFSAGMRSTAPAGVAKATPKPERFSTLARIQDEKMAKNKTLKHPREMKHSPPEAGVKHFPKDTRKSILMEHAKGRAEKRKQGIRSASRGPSFAMRHPLVTGGAGLLAGKALFGENKETPDPKIVYPQ